MFYIELERKNWDFSRLQAAWQQVLTRHKKLFNNELPSTAFKIALLDCAKDNPDALRKKQELLRQELLNGKSKEVAIQGFAIKAISSVNALRLFIAFAPGLMKGRKFSIIWREWQAYYQDNNLELASVGYQPVADYWNKRLEKLPDSAPILPKKIAEPNNAVIYEHHEAKLPANDYRRLKVLSQTHQLSLTTLLLTMIQDIVVDYVQSTDFRLNLLLENRLPLYPYLGDKADYATSLCVLPITATAEKSFLQRAAGLSAALREDAKYLSTAVLPMLDAAELSDNSVLPLIIECNLQQGLRQALFAAPADITYYSGEDYCAHYAISIFEEAGDIRYRCSAPKGVIESRKFYLHRLLIERMHKLANDEEAWKTLSANYEAIATKNNNADAHAGKLNLHSSVKALLNYEAALQDMQESLLKNDTKAYAKQFKTQRGCLEECAGNLHSQFDKPPYAEELNALFEGHNALGALFRKDAFEKAKQQIAKNQVHVENLKRIFQESPPKELYEAPEVQAVLEFDKITRNPNLSVEQYKQALEKLQREVFGGSK